VPGELVGPEAWQAGFDDGRHPLVRGEVDPVPRRFASPRGGELQRHHPPGPGVPVEFVGEGTLVRGQSFGHPADLTRRGRAS